MSVYDEKSSRYCEMIYGVGVGCGAREVDPNMHA